MSVEHLQRLHGRYAHASARFRAVWAFHQFLESIRKLFPDVPRSELASQLQEVYAGLRSIAAHLSAAQADSLDGQLDTADTLLDELVAALAEQDNRVSPQAVRQFFQRVKSQDEGVLTQLIKFIVLAGATAGWSDDRLDKLDLLLTRVAQERDDNGRFVLVERRRLRELASGLWSLAATAEPAAAEIDAALESIRELRQGAAAAADLDTLNDQEIVPSFRAVKRQLGPKLLHTRLLPEVLETNLVLKNLIHQLYSVEERRITSEYQRVFDLEREVMIDPGLNEDLQRLHHDVEAFETRLQHDELKLEELSRLRRQVRRLSNRLEDGEENGPIDLDEDVDGTGGEHLVRDAMARLAKALEGIDPNLSPARAVLGSDVYTLHLEPREVLAHRRLRAQSDGAGSALDRLVLEAAALRVALADRVEEIKSLLDESSATGDAPVFPRTRRTLQLASRYVRRLEVATEQAVVGGRTLDAGELTILRMRLVRTHAGGWLLAVKPLVGRSGAE